MSFCPAYWDWLDQQYRKGSLASIISVCDELYKFGDELSDWVKTRKDPFQDISDKDIQLKFAVVAQYVADLPNKNQGDIADFLSKADPWLIAKAANTGAIVVTHEVAVPDDCIKERVILAYRSVVCIIL